MSQEVKISININRNIKNWAINCIRFYYQRTLGNIFVKRDPKLWVFSAWEGVRYSDNSRSLFEYINEHNEKNIQCIWMTKREDVYENILKKGFKATLIGTNECKKYQKKAGVAIRTHGLDDFGDFPYILGAYNVHVCHGIGGNKRTYYALRKSNEIKKLLSIMKAKIFNYAYRDMTIATSSFCEKTIRIETLSTKDMPIIGLSRNDLIIEPIKEICEVFNNEFIRKNGLSIKYKYITFMPTYRPLEKSQKTLENTIKMLVDNETLNNLLKENAAKFIIKLHYATDISKLNGTENIFIIKDEEVEDTQKLIRLSDLLITDYSSCAMDFSLKQKDVIFFTPDLDEYEKETGFYKEFMDFLKEYGIDNIEQLINRIESNFENDFSLSETTFSLNKLFNEKVDEVGTFRKQTYEYICNKIGI